MNVAIIGTGYVGLVTGTCLAEHGHHVSCVDSATDKVEMLRQGKIPIYEPGLEDLVVKNTRLGRLEFTEDTASAIARSQVAVIAVGTPPLPHGEADLTAVRACAIAIGDAMAGYLTIVIKSTVPIGTGDLVANLVADRTHHDFDVVSNPEFLREGSAVYDALHPHRIVVGADRQRAAEVLESLYASLDCPFVKTDRRSAEMIKYASNSFLAVKISFINEIAGLCERLGADVTEVARGMGYDPRIGASFLNAGLGYGGSCFPKDTEALVHMGVQLDYTLPVVEAAMSVNRRQRVFLLDKVRRALNGVQGRTIAVLGLAFKPNTDDVRDAAAFDLIQGLTSEGASVRAYDPIATANARATWLSVAKHEKVNRVGFCESVWDSVDGADAVIVATEWPEFVQLDWASVRQRVAQPLLFDGRNCLDPDQMRRLGFAYHGVGRA